MMHPRFEIEREYAVRVMGQLQPQHLQRLKQGIELETLGRARLLHLIGLRVDVTAPTWNQVLFSSKRIALRLQAPPKTVLDAIDQLPPAPPPPGAPPDAVRDEAQLLLNGLSQARPRGTAPRSIAGGAKLPPPSDLYAKWLRRVYLVVTGPVAIRLLTAAGYLLPDDLDVMDVIYPKGLDDERKNAVAGAIAFANAKIRGGHDHSLPAWLNDQLLTLMDEQRLGKYFQDIYAKEAKAAGPPQSPQPSTTPNLIAQQSAPNSFDRTP